MKTLVAIVVIVMLVLFISNQKSQYQTMAGTFEPGYAGLEHPNEVANILANLFSVGEKLIIPVIIIGFSLGTIRGERHGGRQ